MGFFPFETIINISLQQHLSCLMRLYVRRSIFNVRIFTLPFSFFSFVCWIYTEWRYLSLKIIIEETAPKEVRISKHVVSLLVIMHTEPMFSILHHLFLWSTNYGSRVYTTCYLPLLKLACILLKIEVYNAGLTTRGRDSLPQFFSTKSSFCSLFLLFSRRCTNISEFGFDFERALFSP